MNAHQRITPTPVSRRRFLQISAGFAVCAAGLAGPAGAAVVQDTPLHSWRGIALGADAEMRLYHPDAAEAQRIFARAEAEIRRLEAIFSLYRHDSSLSRLNATGRLEAPPFELLELLTLSKRLHRETGGAFDPSVQPLWAAYAEGFSTSATGPDEETIRAARARVGFDGVVIDTDAISFARPGMALTLNGIAQGFISDRVSALLREEGLTDILVDLGEIRANGTPPDGAGWPIVLDPERVGNAAQRIRLKDRAVASSAVTATTFDAKGRIGHILDPRSGAPADGPLRGASVIATSAAIADGLSTAALVLGTQGLEDALAAFPRSRARVVERNGTTRWLPA